MISPPCKTCTAAINFLKNANTFIVGYFNYHATAKRLIKDGKLKEYRFLDEYNGIKDVLLLIFDDRVHPVMPIRKPRQSEYLRLLGLDDK